MRKRIFSALLACALVLSMLAGALPVSASGVSSIAFTKNPQENITFTVSGGTLTISNLPNTTAFREVLVVLLDSGLSDLDYGYIDRNNDGSAAYSLPSLTNGDYYIEFYYYAGNDLYSSYIFGYELCLRWQDGVGRFTEAPTLEHNRGVVSKARSDNAALTYYLAPSSLIQSTAPAIVTLAGGITSGIEGEYKKAIAIHDWVCDNLWYNWDAVESGDLPPEDAVSTLNNRIAVCTGFANLTAALLRASGIPAKPVYGIGNETALAKWTSQMLANPESNHAWVEAFIAGRWVIIDTTWDSGNDFYEGVKRNSDGTRSHRYFDATIEAFSFTHWIEPYEEDHIQQQDAPTPWAVKEVDAALDLGLVPVGLGMYFSDVITRAEFCALAVTLYETLTGNEITERAKFNDTNDINVEKMAALGVVDGVGGGRFAPDSSLNREQAATMLARLAGAIGKPLPLREATFADNAQISTWALVQAGQVQAAGVMGGVGSETFSPKSNYTREQSIATIYRLYLVLQPLM